MVVVPTMIGLVARRRCCSTSSAASSAARSAASCGRPTTCRRSCPSSVAGIVIGLDPAPRRDGALNQMLETSVSASLAHDWLGRSRHRAAHRLMVRAGLGPDRLPRRHLHGGAAAGRSRAVRGGRARRRELVPAVPAITVQHIRPEIFVVTLTCTIAALKVFGPVYVLTRGGPAARRIVPAYYAYTEFFTKPARRLRRGHRHRAHDRRRHRLDHLHPACRTRVERKERAGLVMAAGTALVADAPPRPLSAPSAAAAA